MEQETEQGNKSSFFLEYPLILNKGHHFPVKTLKTMSEFTVILR